MGCQALVGRCGGASRPLYARFLPLVLLATRKPSFGIEESRLNELVLVGLEWLGALALFLGFIALVRYLDHRERMSMIEHGIFATPESNQRRTARGTARCSAAD